MSTTHSSHMVIAIDGPSGAGKSTAAKRLAALLGYCYVDSGALYRGVGWVAQQQAVSLHSPEALEHLLGQLSLRLTVQQGQCEVWVQQQNITGQLQGEMIGKSASAVALLPAVRQFITSRLRRLRWEAHLVMEGRDIGTVVFPDAPCKFFLDASLEKRGWRRFQEMQQAGFTGTADEVIHAMAQRDAQDRNRSAAPLHRAADAYLIDTTDLAIDDVVQTMLSHIQSNIPTA